MKPKPCTLHASFGCADQIILAAIQVAVALPVKTAVQMAFQAVNKADQITRLPEQWVSWKGAQAPQNHPTMTPKQAAPTCLSPLGLLIVGVHPVLGVDFARSRTVYGQTRPPCWPACITSCAHQSQLLLRLLHPGGQQRSAAELQTGRVIAFRRGNARRQPPHRQAPAAAVSYAAAGMFKAAAGPISWHWQGSSAHRPTYAAKLGARANSNLGEAAPAAAMALFAGLISRVGWSGAGAAGHPRPTTRAGHGASA